MQILQDSYLWKWRMMLPLSSVCRGRLFIVFGRFACRGVGVFSGLGDVDPRSGLLPEPEAWRNNILY
uniref:Uncharacterized protein n=1 Tax=Candidatus Kentrum sp. MB TaxID=2138164 RepID=A0A450XMZ1_9GAMM|nr:MAG: hypothetical protein BECKMB1821G_GA0114241_100775 [Candidatus Kentron sp. MB]VFK30616.1 MAG: hypothetical protein BECKMB1821I_GA0114274_101658 [Candidatus Kentron sp. MB]VFK75324.1 MAG: hypothetical protein BECKMB1821H_GA0114242_101957 [Candidatus Kentron sp. MB]